MEWLKPLKGKVVGLDTAPLIYFIEQNPDYLKIDRKEFRVVTSTLTLTEVLVHPLRNGNAQLAQQYQNILLNQDNFTTFSVSAEIAKLAAEVRATSNLRTPDAIQIATAIIKGADFVLTNDISWRNLPHLQVIVLDEIKATE
jgi:predicted nucleic acid-binding protein